jgi:hypothetical protein
MDTLKAWIDTAASATGMPRNLLLASLILAAGFAFAFLARALIARFVRDFGRLLSAGGAARFEQMLERHRLDALLGRATFWIALLWTLLTATHQLGFPVITAWIGGLTAYLPRVLLGMVIVFAGVVTGALARGALSRALPASDIVDPQGVGGLAQGVIVGFAVLMAMQHLGVDVGFITTVITIALIGFFAAGALAFGFGGRATVANILASHYVRELYEVGQTVRVHGLEGRIVRMTPTAVILATPDGETAVPAHIFVEASSTRLADGGRL